LIKKIYKNRLISSSIIEEVENASLLREGRKIVEALGKMFAPFCEVVLHDLSKPDHSVIAIECPLSEQKS
jgi:predicted transcriptional regulator YheO